MTSRRVHREARPQREQRSGLGKDESLTALERELHSKRTQMRPQRSAERAEATSLAQPGGRFIGRPVA